MSCSFAKNVRIIAMLKRSIRRFKGEKIFGDLEQEEIEEAETFIFHKIQEESFPMNQNVVENLQVVRGGDDLLRIKTKITNMPESESFRKPVLLPSNHPVVWQLIRSEHIRNMHAGLSITMTKEKLEFLSSSFVNHAEELSHIKKQMFNFKSELDRFINKFIGLEQQVKKNAETILRYETKPNANCDRQCNIIIHGCEYYSAKTAMKETTDFLSNCLEVDVTVKDVRPLSNGKSVLVKLASTKQKSMVFRNCHKLKAIPAKISIVEDLSKEERAKKRRQIPAFLEQKKIGNKVYFRGADLFVNGTQITEEIIISPYHDVSHSVTAQTKNTEKTEKLDHAKCGQPPIEKTFNPKKTINSIHITWKDHISKTLNQVQNYPNQFRMTA
ncbi:hypothetical protein Fcan01_17795 [Folsomia candida]|uniref:Uncharacterized protein n=1 Tax=Folsomia candida TaxID=158441 RepID=A0A226DS30_FOLCA|nr:hypothetical protein Fcan01_17795 [Folsomia candida]